MPSFIDALKSAFRKTGPRREPDYQPLGAEQIADSDAPITREQHLSRLKDEAAHMNELRKNLRELMPRHYDDRLQRKNTLANGSKIDAVVTRAYQSSRATGASLQYALDRQLETKLLSKKQKLALKETYEEARASTLGTSNELVMAKLIDAHCHSRRLAMATTEFTSGKTLEDLKAQTAGYLQQAPAPSVEEMTRQDYRKNVHGFDSQVDDPRKAWAAVKDEASRLDELAAANRRAGASARDDGTALSAESDRDNIVTPSGAVIRSKNPYWETMAASIGQSTAVKNSGQAEASTSRLTPPPEAPHSGVKLK